MDFPCSLLRLNFYRVKNPMRRIIWKTYIIKALKKFLMKKSKTNDAKQLTSIQHAEKKDLWVDKLNLYFVSNIFIDKNVSIFLLMSFKTLQLKKSHVAEDNFACGKEVSTIVELAQSIRLFLTSFGKESEIKLKFCLLLFSWKKNHLIEWITVLR